jgi:uncharacterized protein
MGAATVSLDTDALSPAEGRRAQLAAELDRLVPMIIERYDPKLLLLFGSFATGRVQERSDLDLVVVAESAVPFSRRLDHFYRTVLPRVGLDALVYTPNEWADLRESRRFVQEEIVKKGVVLYERAG